MATANSGQTANGQHCPTLTTAEALIPLILDSQFKSLDFVSLEHKTKTEQHLHQLFKQEKENQKKTSDISNTSETPDISNNSKSKKKKNINRKTCKR